MRYISNNNNNNNISLYWHTWCGARITIDKKKYKKCKNMIHVKTISDDRHVKTRSHNRHHKKEVSYKIL